MKHTQTWRIVRRFSQVIDLDKTLREHFGKMIPSQPRHRPGSSPAVLRERCGLIQTYFDTIVDIPAVENSDIFNKWLNTELDPVLFQLNEPEMCGYLQKEGHIFRNWKTRFFILKSPILAYFSDENYVTSLARPKGIMSLVGATLRPAVERGPFYMEILFSGTPSLFIKAGDEATFQAWSHALNHAISHHVDREVICPLEQAEVDDPPEDLPAEFLISEILNDSNLIRIQKDLNSRLCEFVKVISAGLQSPVNTRLVEIAKKLMSAQIQDLLSTHTGLQTINVVHEAGREDPENSNVERLLEIFSPVLKIAALVASYHRTLAKKTRVRLEHVSMLQNAWNHYDRLREQNFAKHDQVKSPVLSPNTVPSQTATPPTTQPSLLSVHSPPTVSQVPTSTAPPFHLDLKPTKSTSQEEICNPPTPKRFMCRICELYYPHTSGIKHTHYCEIASECTNANASIENKLSRLSEVLQECRAKEKMDERSLKLALLAEEISGFSYGRNSVRPCEERLRKIQEILHTDTDIVTQTIGHWVCILVEEKIDTIKLLCQKQQTSNNWWNKGLLRLLWGPNQSPSNMTLKTQRKPYVTYNDFLWKKKISSGAFGEVWLANKKTTGDQYAIKILDKCAMIRKNMVDRVNAEREIMSKLHNEFIVKLYFAFQCEKSLYLVMEYCIGGDVASLLANIGPFEESMARVYIAETILALECLHKLNFVHRDIKPENLLLNKEGHIRLTDFGISEIGLIQSSAEMNLPEILLPSQNHPTGISASKSLSHPILLPVNTNDSNTVRTNPRVQTRILGTPDYLAPEILLGAGHGAPVDYWAVGIMLYELLTGIPPFNADSPTQIFQNILRHSINWECSTPIAETARDLISQLLEPEPSERLGSQGADDVKKHPFFSSINWDTLRDTEGPFVPNPDDEDDTSYFLDHRFSKDTSAHQPPLSCDMQQARFQNFNFTSTANLADQNRLDVAEYTEAAAGSEGADESQFHSGHSAPEFVAQTTTATTQQQPQPLQTTTTASAPTPTPTPTTPTPTPTTASNSNSNTQSPGSTPTPTPIITCTSTSTGTGTTTSPTSAHKLSPTSSHSTQPPPEESARRRRSALYKGELDLDALMMDDEGL
ncbi:protein serine/threonine kinase [Pelomyxa schiedti]|nr:protein serine/threonine kinase [Pelomyxa schiedti]